MSTQVDQDIRVGLRYAVPRVNLLPPEIAQRRALRRAQFGAGGVAMLAVAAVAFGYVVATGQVHSAQSSLDGANAQRQGLQTQVGRYQYVTDTQAKVEARQQMLRLAMGGEVQWSHFLNDLSVSTPDNVWLKTVSVVPGTSPATGSAPVPAAPSGTATPAAGGTTTAGQPVATVTFTGVAIHYNDVAVWLESFAKQHAIVQAYVTDTSTDKIGTTAVVNVTGSFVVTQDALSKRYTQPAGN
jgi:Tfp pilus assembly protein PilN